MGAQLGGWGKLPTVRQSYLLSGMHPTTADMHPNVSAYRLPTVRQSYLQSGKATYSQASYLLSGMHPNVAADFAPNNRIHAPNRAIDMHPKGIDMHPKVSIDLHPKTAYFLK